jgi:hypothetical protein
MKKLLFVFALLFLGVFVYTQTAPAAVEHTFHGQFRINSFHQDASDETDFAATVGSQKNVGSRLRYRPTWEVEFDNGVKLHLQLNIGHIPSTTPIPFMEGWTLVGGLVPLSDRFGDTLFSGDWDFNPLTYALIGKVGEADVRFGHGVAAENDFVEADDVDLWLLDVDLPMGLGISAYRFADYGAPGGFNKDTQYYIGARYATDVGTAHINGWILYNSGEREALGAGLDRDNEGWAASLQGKVPVGPAKVGLLLVYASGDEDYQSSVAGRDSDSFITPMSLYGGTGYWGYTGKLNVQGPTDTAIDQHMVNIDGGSAPWNSQTNLGNGMLTLQANASFNLIPDQLDGYLGVGWFQSDDSPTGVDDDIGFDVIAMGNYHFGSGLNLEFGVDYATLGEGHFDSVDLGPGLDEERDVILVFSRFQLEY